jgi:hypothetical protein
MLEKCGLGEAGIPAFAGKTDSEISRFEQLDRDFFTTSKAGTHDDHGHPVFAGVTGRMAPVSACNIR